MNEKDECGLKPANNYYLVSFGCVNGAVEKGIIYRRGSALLSLDAAVWGITPGGST